jgi:hypothetical protein
MVKAQLVAFVYGNKLGKTIREDEACVTNFEATG